MEKKRGYCLLLGMALGACFGSVAYVLTKNIALLPLGSAFGMSVGIVFSAHYTKKDGENGSEKEKNNE